MAASRSAKENGSWPSAPDQVVGANRRRPVAKKKGAQQQPIKDWVQLFDLEADPAETKNLASSHPEIVTNLTALMQKYIDTGRSTPGAPQKNNGETFLYPQWIQKGRQKI